MTSTRFFGEAQFDVSSLNHQDVQTPGDVFSVYDHSRPSYDGLPRSTPQQLLFEPSSYPPIIHGRYYPAQLSQSQMDYSEVQDGNYQFFSPERYYEPCSGEAGNSETFSQATRDGLACPRNWTHHYDPRLTGDLTSGYLIEPQMGNDPTDPIVVEDKSGYDCVTGNGPQNFPQMSIKRSPTMEGQLTYASPAAFEYKPFQTGARSSPVSELGDDEVGKESLSGSEKRITDEPYAKLIYRALLSAPNHSMVLQEIYQWFKDNTDKGSSGTSGWRNSIRHNLSMNAAFRKADRRMSDDDSKKTSEWVLEPFAMKEGITPTTRYRIKNKKTRSLENPKTSQLRIVSGRKGGLSAGKRSSQRQKVRDNHHREPTPAMYQDRRQDRMTPTERNRHVSPSTPPAVDLAASSDPYVVSLSHPYSYGGLEASGVYEAGPAFYPSSEISRFADPQAYMWPHFSRC